MTARIQFDRQAIEAFCRRHDIRKLSLFGSLLREDFTPESDVDVLVEFEAGKEPGLAFFSMGEELAQIIGRRVDFLTKGWISPHYRDEVIRQAETVYAAA